MLLALGEAVEFALYLLLDRRPQHIGIWRFLVGISQNIQQIALILLHTGCIQREPGVGIEQGVPYLLGRQVQLGGKDFCVSAMLERSSCPLSTATRSAAATTCTSLSDRGGGLSDFGSEKSSGDPELGASLSGSLSISDIRSARRTSATLVR